MDITGRLKRISSGTYQDSKNYVWRLVPVDREYTCKRKPVYFLQKITNNKAQYISGVFKTKTDNIFSADIKDGIGVKKYYEIKSINAGEELIISISNKQVK